MAKFKCTLCPTEIDYEPCMVSGREMFTPKYCFSCLVEVTDSNELRVKQEEKAVRESEWLNICPPLYRQTEQGHPDMPKQLLKTILKWRPGTDGRGIGIFGETGKCKTRVMFLLVQKLHMSGVKVLAISSTRLGRCFSLGFGDNAEADGCRETVKKARYAEVLFLDDLGKERFTDRVESEFYDLIEYRTSHLKPTLWTANATGKELAAMMSADRGAAIVRRLRDFSEPIEL